MIIDSLAEFQKEISTDWDVDNMALDLMACRYCLLERPYSP
jgi:hypothetical protein